MNSGQKRYRREGLWTISEYVHEICLNKMRKTVKRLNTWQTLKCGYYSVQALADIPFYWGNRFKCCVETVLYGATGRIFPVLNPLAYYFL